MEISIVLGIVVITAISGVFIGHHVNRKTLKRFMINKPSIACRFAKWQLNKRGGKAYITSGLSTIAILFFSIAILYLILGIWTKQTLNFVNSILMVGGSTMLFMVAGFLELIDREYIKKDSNQWVEPTVKTPVDLGNVQGTDTAHL